MPDVFDLLTQVVGERPSAPFATLLVVHIAAGLTAIVAGAAAMLSAKRSGRHPKAGRMYYTALCVVCATALGMAAMRWPEDAYLVVLGALSLAAASLAYLARHYRWHGWIRQHILGMGTSYIVLITAFYRGQRAAPSSLGPSAGIGVLDRAKPDWLPASCACPRQISRRAPCLAGADA